ncbi:hypothetical protein C7271_22030, partial [filamentous cyanobacterium CCP5]
MKQSKAWWVYGPWFAMACVAALLWGQLTLAAEDSRLIGVEGQPVPPMMTAIAQATPAQPRDIDRHWAQDCIQGLVQRRLATIDSQGYFYPEATVSWQELTQVLNLMFPTGRADSWANPLEQALGLTGANVASHYPDHYYLPSRAIARGEALMALAAKVNGSFLTQANGTLRASLTDADQIPHFAREGVAAALARRLVVDYPEPTRLRPNDLLTRGELAAMLCRASGNEQLQGLVPAGAIAPFQTPPPAAPPTTERRGVWLTNIDSQVLFSQDNLVEAVDRLAALNFNTLYPTVWNWGDTLYPS